MQLNGYTQQLAKHYSSFGWLWIFFIALGESKHAE